MTYEFDCPQYKDFNAPEDEHADAWFGQCAEQQQATSAKRRASQRRNDKRCMHAEDQTAMNVQSVILRSRASFLACVA